jgi:hypothetical protein
VREAKFILESLNCSKANVEKKLEVDQLKSEVEKLKGYLQVYDCLIAKYEILASGKKKERKMHRRNGFGRSGSFIFRLLEWYQNW